MNAGVLHGEIGRRQREISCLFPSDCSIGRLKSE